MKINTEDLTIVIPCFNESETIESVLKDFSLQFPTSLIKVVDNNSTDKTYQKANSFIGIVKSLQMFDVDYLIFQHSNRGGFDYLKKEIVFNDKDFISPWRKKLNFLNMKATNAFEDAIKNNQNIFYQNSSFTIFKIK